MGIHSYRSRTLQGRGVCRHHRRRNHQLRFWRLALQQSQLCWLPSIPGALRFQLNQNQLDQLESQLLLSQIQQLPLQHLE